MKRKIGIAAVSFALASAGAATAFAQDYTMVPVAPTTAEADVVRPPLTAPRGAFEIGVSTGYTQGFGSIYAGRNIGTVGDAAFSVGLDLGGRVTPGFSLGFTGQYQEYMADDDLPRGTNVRGTTAGIQAVFHGAPFSRLDPWASLGTAYRLMWVVPDGPNNNDLYHGFEFGKLQLGLDIRASRDVAVGPYIGGSVNMFAWRNPEGPIGNISLPDKRASAYIFAGVAGRFDLGGAREAKLSTVGSR